MNAGKATKIFMSIGSDAYTAEEKGAAIFEICRMPTHMGITKDAMLAVIRWLLALAFDLPGEGDEA